MGYFFIINNVRPGAILLPPRSRSPKATQKTFSNLSLLQAKSASFPKLLPKDDLFRSLYRCTLRRQTNIPLFTTRFCRHQNIAKGLPYFLSNQMVLSLTLQIRANSPSSSTLWPHQNQRKPLWCHDGQQHQRLLLRRQGIKPSEQELYSHRPMETIQKMARRSHYQNQGSQLGSMELSWAMMMTLLFLSFLAFMHIDQTLRQNQYRLYKEFHREWKSIK